MKPLTPIVAFVLALLSACQPESPKKQTPQAASGDSLPQLTIMFYNTENLFDTIDSYQYHDEEFMPDGEKMWTHKRYLKKLAGIGRVIEAVDKKDLPDIVGLVEVENINVLKDLIRVSHLNKANYQIVHYESPDYRGIDVALLYKADIFRLLAHRRIPITFSFDTSYTTRDILYAKGILPHNDTLHIFVNHWPSRRGGLEASQAKRLHVAGILRKQVDSLFDENAEAKILIGGDLNDEPHNQSIREVLGASDQCLQLDQQLHNLLYHYTQEKQGTYNYRGNWNILDHIIVSSALIEGKQGYRTPCNSGRIFKADWLLYKDKETGNISPSRTYGGPNYYGGFSDHLPVFVVLQ